MCEPTTIAIVAGVGTAAGGGMKAIAQHRAQQAAARRQNQINQLKFQQDLQIAAHKDQVKANAYKRQLEAHAAAQTALYQQMKLNQQEKTRVSIAAQQALQETATELAFEDQAKLIAQIQDQGSILASDAVAGQSMLLQIMESERKLGMEQAQLTASMVDANKAYRIQEYGFDLDKYSADTAAMNRLPGAPVAESASFGPLKLPDVKGPSGLGLLGGLISAGASGLSAGISAGNKFHTAQTEGFLS